MAKARKILKRRNAVKSIRTVTKTMEMVSTARFRRSHTHAAAARPYTDRLTRMVGEVLARHEGKISHPLLDDVERTKREVMFIISSNRGLCGGYNQAILRVALERLGQVLQAGYDVQVHVSGKKGISYLRYQGMQVDREYTDLDGLPDYNVIGRLAERFMRQFMDGRIGGLEVAYTRMISATQSRPVIAQILPIDWLMADQSETDEQGIRRPYELHPSGEDVLRNLLPAAVRLRLYQCFLDATVVEQISRMTAMRSATENADELIGSLTVQYNRMRQQQITTELSEIIGGRSGLE